MLLPGVTREYTAGTSLTATSTAANAALAVDDRGAAHPGRLVNGGHALTEPLLVRAGGGAFGPVGRTLLTWDGPVTNGQAGIELKQSIAASEPLRTGTYGKTLTFTLSTTAP